MVCLFCVVPRSLTSPGSSSPALHLLLEVPSVRTCSCLPTGSAFLGVSSPNRGISSESSLTSDFPCSLYDPFSVFRTLSTVYTSHCLVSLFHLTTTSRILLSGVSSRHSADPAFTGSFPPVVSHRFLSSIARDSRSDEIGFRAFVRVAIRDCRQKV